MESALQNFRLGVDLGEAILSLQGSALDQRINQIAQTWFGQSELVFSRGRIENEESTTLCAPITGDAYYRLSLSGISLVQQDYDRLNLLSALTARLFATRTDTEKQYEVTVQQHMLQAQILEQIHESVITMDLAGFIMSWNRGAERIFGYTAPEIIGKNILFLYEGEEEICAEMNLLDTFLEMGGREMEVRRRRKNGEIFWASLSLSLLTDHHEQPIGLIGYLSDITQRKEDEQKINHLAYFDSLTNLPNRSLFKQLVDKTMQQAHRKKTTCAILFIDLNRFKPVNDTFGHQTGDTLLAQVAQRFQEALREDDVVARLGGDEFAIVLSEMNQHYHASLVAQKILSALDTPFYIKNNELSIGASIGISVFPHDGADAELLLQRADIAMYKAKRSPSAATGCYAFYNRGMNEHIAGKLYLESGLRKALDRQEFSLVYQPKVDLRSRQISSVETLLRWMHPERGIISPIEFIELAEETGLIIELDAWVLNGACKQARIWQDMGMIPFRIAVNVSAKEFTVSLPGRVSAALLKHQIAPQWLELEITESMLMHSTESVIAIMEKIVDLGVTLALDDFGTGYSSLSYLKRFPISSLKIDRSFVQGIPDDSNDCAIASAIILIAHQLKLKVVAEGVETPEQLAFLAEADCDEIQGYLFSRPTTPENIVNFLQQGCSAELSTIIQWN